MHGRHAQRARREPAIQSRPLPVRVHDVDAVPLHQPQGERQVAHAETRQRQLDHRHAELAKPIVEDAVARRRDHHVELVLGQMAHQVVHVLRPAARARRDEHVQHGDGAAHRVASAGGTGAGGRHVMPDALAQPARREAGGERPDDEDRAPPRIEAALHRAPAHARLGTESLVVARRGHAGRQEAPDDERLGQVREPRRAADPHPEVVVLRHGNARVVAADRLDEAPAHHHRRVDEGIAPDQRAADRGVLDGRRDERDVASRRVHLAGAGAEEPDVGMRVEEGALTREAIRQRDVVRVQPRDERGAGERERVVQRRREAARRLATPREASDPGRPRAASGVASTEPSSTTISSRSAALWSSTLRTASRTHGAPFRTLMSTDTAGVVGVISLDATELFGGQRIASDV